MSWLTTYILPFVALLGILVFVHESGHFLTAKYFKIVVEKFSIGFGPRIFGKKIGDTEYRVAWIPLGGYVKMAGDDPTDEGARSLPGSFLGAPLWKRMLVVLAGPAVNLILPVFVLTGVYMVGKDFAAAVVGSVPSNTPAARAGIKAGDQVVAVDGVAVQKWDDMTERIRSHAPGQAVTLTVSRDGKNSDFKISTEMHENADEFGIKKEMPLVGISAAAFSARLDPVPGSAAEKSGLLLGDEVQAVGETRIATEEDFQKVMAALPPGPVTLSVERPGVPPSDLEAPVPTPTSIKASLTVPAEAGSRIDQLGLHDAQLVVARVERDSPADHAGIQPGDRLVSAGGQVFGGAIDYYSLYNNDKPRPDMPVQLIRAGEPVEVKLSTVMKSRKSFPGSPHAEEVPYDGIALWGNTAPNKIWTEKYSNPFLAFSAGLRGTGEIISMNVRAFSKIFKREIPVRESVGGPIRIAQMAGLAAKAGAGVFLDLLVQMSVILGIMNLLPIPVLDGGHLAFFTIEAILRRPPSLRVREVAQQVGMLLLLAVMAFVMVNDVVTSIF